MPIVLNGTTGITTPSQTLTSAALSTAVAGNTEWDGKVQYFTPQGTQRGAVPSEQIYVLNSPYAGSNVNTAQSIFGVGVTLSSSTFYAFESVFGLSKTSGLTAHTLAFGFGGTATLNNIGYWAHNQADVTAYTTVPYSGTMFDQWIATGAAQVVTGSIGTAGSYRLCVLRGTVSVNSGGTFIPQYTLSAAPGGAYSTATGGYFKIYPIGASGANVSVGTWA